MRLEFKRELLNTCISMELPDLERIIKKAPAKINYKPDNNGFYLENEIVMLRYTAVHFGGRDDVELWFKETEPKISISSDFTNMNMIPTSLLCDKITAHQGIIGVYFIPIGEKIGDTISANKHSYDAAREGDFTVSYEWFDRGTRILQQAAKKYKLKNWHKIYTKKQGIIKDKNNYNLMSRAHSLKSRVLGFLTE